MSIEENRKIHKKFIEEIHMRRNLDALDDFYKFPLTSRGESYTSDDIKQWLKMRWEKQDKENKRLVRVEYHAIVCEGDFLTEWQTSHFKDGSSQEGVNIYQFENGKITTHRWFPTPENTE